VTNPDKVYSTKGIDTFISAFGNNILQNLTRIFIIYVLVFVITVFIGLFQKFIFEKIRHKGFHDFCAFICRKFLFNPSIRIAIETYQTLSLACMIALLDIRGVTICDKVCSVTTVIVLGYLIIIPHSMYKFVRVYRS
jgi:hypothetical protein